MVEQNDSLGEISKPLRKIPIVSASDVEFSSEFADEDDLEAMQRAEAATNRVAPDKGE